LPREVSKAEPLAMSGKVHEDVALAEHLFDRKEIEDVHAKRTERTLHIGRDDTGLNAGCSRQLCVARSCPEIDARWRQLSAVLSDSRHH